MQRSPRSSFAMPLLFASSSALLLLVTWSSRHPSQAAAAPCSAAVSDPALCGCSSRRRRDLSINNENGDWIQIDDMVLPKQSKTLSDYYYLPGIDPRNLHLWPGGIVFYAFMGNFSAKFKAVIKSSMENIQTRVGTNHLEFREAISKSGKICRKNYVQIQPHSQPECKSMIGMQLNGVTKLWLNEAYCPYRFAVQHEMLHSIGRLHEHQRRDRHKHLDLKFHNLLSAYCTGFAVHSEGLIDASDSLPYDYDSIMHYGSCAGSCIGDHVFVKKTDGGPIGQNDKLTELDVKKLQLLYPAHQKVKYSSRFCTEDNGEAPVPIIGKAPAGHQLLRNEAKRNNKERLAVPSKCLLLMAAVFVAVVAL